MHRLEDILVLDHDFEGHLFADLIQLFAELAHIDRGPADVVGRQIGRYKILEELGIQHVWMHRSVGGGSVSEEAASFGRALGMRVIAGGCPLMFEPASDPGHKVMRSLFTLTGKVPRRV